MRTLFLVGLVLLSAFSILSAQKPLTITPEKPKPGEMITIRYNPVQTPLEGASDFDAMAYLLEGSLPVVKEIKLAREGSEYVGQVQTNDTTRALFFSFQKDEVRDNNNDLGYYTLLYTPEGKPVPGARLSLGNGFSYGNFWGLKRNPIALTLIKEEFSSDPAAKVKYRHEYWSSLAQSKDEADKEQLRKEISDLIGKPDAKEADFIDAKIQYEMALNDPVKAAEIFQLIKTKFPDGTWQINDRLTRFYEERDPWKKELVYKEIIEKYPAKTEEDQMNAGDLASSLASAFGEAGNYDKMKEYAAKVKNKSSLSGTYNNIAWKATGESINGKPGNLQKAKELSWQSLQIIQDEMKSGAGKPSYLTEKQWKHSQESTYYTYADTYALLLYHLKDYKNAYEYQKKAVEHFKGNEVSMNEAYSAYVEKVKGPKEAQAEIEKFMRDGKSSPVMKQQLKRIYLAQKKTETDWRGYVAVLEKASREKKEKEIAKTMINQPAPSFIIKDIDGTEVSLASLKGKVVVVDFWATWCGPCIASFPGMKKAVEKYKQDPDVKFVFIDTWENGEQQKVKKDVADFIKKNAYPFHVLMDYDSKIVESYNVEGIPTKFIIDKNNNIRFKSVGFSGSADGLVDELAFMIEMSRNNSGSAAGANKKAF